MRYSCLAPGKRLRPALCLASAEAIGIQPASPAVLDAACALEMVHCFSLIHDDLPAIDDDDLRRGAPTCHVRFGEAIALLAGDALFSLAFETLSMAPGDEGRVLRAIRSLSKSTGSDGLVGGEVMDVLAECAEVSENQLERIHSLKTGALIAGSCEIGGLLGSGNEAQVDCLRRFGAKIGLAFQIVDDLLNVTSTPEQLGKAAGSDHARGKATYPALHGMAESTQAAKRMLEEAVAELGDYLPNPGVLEGLARFSVEREF